MDELTPRSSLAGENQKAKHLTVRLVWHDRAWDGRICNRPSLNTSCVMHDYVRGSRNDALEDSNAGKPVSELDFIPPCGSDVGAFCGFGFSIKHDDPFERSSLGSVQEVVPPFSCAARPYGRMLADDDTEHTWTKEDEQSRRLEAFFDEIRAAESLVFFYVEHADDLEVESGEKVVVGVSTLKKLGEQLFFGSKDTNRLEHPVWSRIITHGFPNEGVRIPYQEYIAQGRDTSDILVTVPRNARSGFSHVSETISDDIAVGVLQRIFASIRRVRDDGYVHGTWDKALVWLDETIGRLWKDRGPCPGIGPVLNYLGFRGGRKYAEELESASKDLGQFLIQLPRILDGSQPPPKQSHMWDWSRASANWKRLPAARQKLLHMFCILDISKKQVDFWADPDARKELGIKCGDEDILANRSLLVGQSWTRESSSAQKRHWAQTP